MTQQSYPNKSEEVVVSGASTSSDSSNTLSTDVYPLPFSLGQKEVVWNNEERALVSDDNSVLTSGANICINDCNDVAVGNRTFFNGDVTIYQNIQGADLRELPSIRDEVECNKNVRVVPAPPSVSPTPNKPSPGILRRHFKVIMVLLTVATITCAVTLITLRFMGNKKPSYVPFTTEEPTSTSERPPKVHYVMNMSQWGGRELDNKQYINEPVQLVIVKHTKTKACKDLQSCFSAMQDLQNTDVGIHNYSDIRYNFVIGGDGLIYEGRGWGVRNEQMNNTIDIAYMGDFNVDEADAWVMGTGKFLILRGILGGHLSMSNLTVVGHNQTEHTDSPGENLYREIITWEWYSGQIIKSSSRKHDL